MTRAPGYTVSPSFTASKILMRTISSASPPRPTTNTPNPGVSERVTPVQQPTLTTAPAQPQSTDTAPAVQATATVPAAASQDISKAADDLSNMLDDLTKDLNSADSLNGVK